MNDQRMRYAPGLFRRSAPRPLRKACIRTGLDERGSRYRDCPLKNLCKDEFRWLVRPGDGSACVT